MDEIIQHNLKIQQNIINSFEKGNSDGQIGEIRHWKDGDYQKTIEGWKKVSLIRQPKEEISISSIASKYPSIPPELHPIIEIIGGADNHLAAFQRLNLDQTKFQHLYNIWIKNSWAKENYPGKMIWKPVMGPTIDPPPNFSKFVQDIVEGKLGQSLSPLKQFTFSINKPILIENIYYFVKKIEGDKITIGPSPIPGDIRDTQEFDKKEILTNIRNISLPQIRNLTIGDHVNFIYNSQKNEGWIKAFNYPVEAVIWTPKFNAQIKMDLSFITKINV